MTVEGLCSHSECRSPRGLVLCHPVFCYCLWQHWSRWESPWGRSYCTAQWSNSSRSSFSVGAYTIMNDRNPVTCLNRARSSRSLMGVHETHADISFLWTASATPSWCLPSFLPDQINVVSPMTMTDQKCRTWQWRTESAGPDNDRPKVQDLTMTDRKCRTWQWRSTDQLLEAFGRQQWVSSMAAMATTWAELQASHDTRPSSVLNTAQWRTAHTQLFVRDVDSYMTIRNSSIG